MLGVFSKRFITERKLWIDFSDFNKQLKKKEMEIEK